MPSCMRRLHNSFQNLKLMSKFSQERSCILSFCGWSISYISCKVKLLVDMHEKHYNVWFPLARFVEADLLISVLSSKLDAVA